MDREERELLSEEARVKLAAAAKRVKTAQGLAALNRVIGENARDYVARVRAQGGIVVNADF
ncbi:MAG: hypothetical protein LUP91_15055, partial [Methylococcaceae bacterium]|nr:hypothetical protein [Methylococcaceae bacterium]